MVCLCVFAKELWEQGTMGGRSHQQRGEGSSQGQSEGAVRGADL